MSSSLEKFISEIRNGGVARPNRFSVEITKPSCMSGAFNPGVEELPKLISLYCQSASIPGQNIGVRDLRITGPTYKRPVNIDYGGEGIALTFLMDGKFNIKSFFDVWMHRIIDPFQFHANYNEKGTTYTTSIKINQIFDETPSKINVNTGQRLVNPTDIVPYYVKLEDAFPRNIGMMELDQSSQGTAHKMSVTFAYRKLEYISDITLGAGYAFNNSPQR
jgi:hypothetical protein